MSSEKILESVSSATEEHEYYTPVPEGYQVGKTKYIITTGSVMSGLGKGIFSSSLAKLLKFKGLKVSPIKLEGYLNIDSGTLNPYRHGEVFVLDDGLECDMDLGTYERFLDQNLSVLNYTTSGRILRGILDHERKGDYLGRDVQVIPHVTGEIKRVLRELAMKTEADVVMVEVGGTVGDIENNHFIEALRELGYEEGKENVCYMNLTFIMEPGFLGEQKSKAAQLGIRTLMSLGIQPDIIACRSKNPVTDKIREKISIYSNVPFDRVVGVHDCDTVYSIPLILKEAQLDEKVIERLGLHPKIDQAKEKSELENWANYVEKFKNANKKITIGLTGKYTGLRDSYASIIQALEHAGTEHGAQVEIKWIETTEIEEGRMTAQEAIDGCDGVIVAPGFGKRGCEGKIKCCEYVRENNIPYLGICLGFQMALIDFARNVCNLPEANSVEVNPNTKDPVVCILPEQMKIEGLGGTMRLGGFDVEVKPGTKCFELFGSEKTRLRFRHRYECNPEYIKTFEEHGMIFSGKAPNHPIMQLLELPNHPYFVGTQAHPEMTSRPGKPMPLFAGLVEAAIKRKEN